MTRAEWLYVSALILAITATVLMLVVETWDPAELVSLTSMAHPR